MGARPDPSTWVGPKLAWPKGNLIILPLHAEMNSACSGLNEEEGGNIGRRKLHGLGVLNVLRMSGWWLRRLRSRWRWPESAVRGRKKSCRGERTARRRRERAAMAAWWSAGGCAGFLWWSWWWLERQGERRREKATKTRQRGCLFSRFWTRFSPHSGHQIHLYL